MYVIMYVYLQVTQMDGWSFVDEVGVEEAVPDVGHAGEAPVRAVGVAAGVRHLRRRQRHELPPEHRRVRVDAVVRQLREVEHLHVDPFLLQRPEDLLGLLHHAVVRRRALVTRLHDRLALVQALVLVIPSPIARPAKQIHRVFYSFFCLLLLDVFLLMIIMFSFV